MLTLIGVVIALAPAYLRLAPASLLSDLLLSFAGSFWIWSFIGFIVEFGELKKFLSGLDEEGWENFFIAVVFLAPVAGLFGGIAVLELPWWVEIACKLVSLALALVGALFVAATLDSFFIKPRLKDLANTRQVRRSKAERGSLLGGIATAIAWVLSNTSALLLIIERLTAS